MNKPVNEVGRTPCCIWPVPAMVRCLTALLTRHSIDQGPADPIRLPQMQSAA